MRTMLGLRTRKCEVHEGNENEKNDYENEHKQGRSRAMGDEHGYEREPFPENENEYEDMDNHHEYEDCHKHAYDDDNHRENHDKHDNRD